ncbi:AraC family transcriptional regulator [Microvirga puerhi]|uniref:Helix-turn-helix transcriptional regulator n=1 Tax=Microvirga puerhi TaxID=2876078 RepID=A0ABS7VRN4_9HYPH|nr:AraC family transcriptional regulator [Microvirga puerhi]MBZ6077607.1 helix-turn-helix transcriptional regulator [Microvirga puerhi]
MDYSQPMEILRPRHRDISLICSRERVANALGYDPSKLAGFRLPHRGIGALLRSHLRLMAAEVTRLTAEQRAVALSSAVEMGLAALQAELRKVDHECVPDGLYQAARLIIRRDCGDPEFDLRVLVRELGCSRATLYRLFAERGESVAATIWSTRIENAYAMLTTSVHRYLRVGEVAQRCGFTDQSTFNRMFKRRYDVTPLDASRMSAAREVADLDSAPSLRG